MGNYTSGCGKDACGRDDKNFHNAKTFGKRRVKLNNKRDGNSRRSSNTSSLDGQQMMYSSASTGRAG